MIVRDAQDADYEAMRAIYAHHVLDGLGSFEQAAPEAADFAFRMTAIADHGPHAAGRRKHRRGRGYG